ncbi:glycosyltransferase [Kitasatospora sp. NPDC059571]|uniref:scabin-related ADP-ribosyltransferase n=1 Tax=Kitasatospora sp. NPDC059571 TaxID=3346871 RepID=UPI0036B4D25E
MLGILAGHWPKADEDGLHGLATTFDQLAWDAGSLQDRLAAQSVYVPKWQGGAREAHDRAVGQALGDSGLARARESAARMADSIRATRSHVVKAKIQDLEIAAWLIASTTWALASAYITGGASLHLLAALQAAAEELLAAVSRWLLAALQAIGGGMLFMVAADATAQGIELARGDISSFDADSLAQSALGGAVVGVVSLPLGLVVRPAGDALKNALKDRLGGLLGATAGKAAEATADRAVGFANMVATNWVTNAGWGAAEGRADLSLTDAVAGAGAAALHVHAAEHGEGPPGMGHQPGEITPHPAGDGHASGSADGEGWGVSLPDGYWLGAFGKGNLWARPKGWEEAPQAMGFASSVRAMKPAVDGGPRLVVGTPELSADAVLERLASAWRSVQATGVPVSEVVLAAPVGDRRIAVIRDFATRERVTVNALSGQVIAGPGRSQRLPASMGHSPSDPASHMLDHMAANHGTSSASHAAVDSPAPLDRPTLSSAGTPLPVRTPSADTSALPATVPAEVAHPQATPAEQHQEPFRTTPAGPPLPEAQTLVAPQADAAAHQTTGGTRELDPAVAPRYASGSVRPDAAPPTTGDAMAGPLAPTSLSTATVRPGGALLDPPRWEHALTGEADLMPAELADRLGQVTRPEGSRSGTGPFIAESVGSHYPSPPVTRIEALAELRDQPLSVTTYPSPAGARLHDPLPAPQESASHWTTPAAASPSHTSTGDAPSALTLANALDPTGRNHLHRASLDTAPALAPEHTVHHPLAANTGSAPDAAPAHAPAGSALGRLADHPAAGQNPHTQPNEPAPGPRATDPAESTRLRAALARDFNPLMDAATPDTALARILGPDVFGLRQAPPAPEFLHGYDFTRVKADQRSALYRTLDLTHDAPHHQDLSSAALEHRPDSVTASQRQWVRRADVPGLPKRPKIPHTLHSIWLGGPLRDHGATHAFRENVAAAARALPGFDVVVWTDVPRAQFDDARSSPLARRDTGRLAEVRSMLDWARDNGVRLVNVDEVFSAGTPMDLQALYRTETAKQIGPGYAAASDILRIEILKRFGGVYSDGDNTPSANLGMEVQRIADSPHGFAVGTEMGRNTNAVLVSPAGHRFLDAYQDAFTDNYTRTPYENVLRNEELRVGHRDVLAPMGPDRPLAAQIRPQSPQAVRAEVLHRTGPSPNVFEPLAAALGLAKRADLPQVTEDVFTRSSRSRLPDSRVHTSAGREVPAPPTMDESAQTARRLAASLVHELHSQPGNLNLARYASVAEEHGNPGVVWDTVLGLIAADPRLRHMVDSVTLDVLDSNGRPTRTVDLPAYSRDLLDLTHRTDVHDQVLPPGTFPARLREPGVPWESGHENRPFDAAEGERASRNHDDPQPVSTSTRLLLGTGGHGLAGLLLNYGAHKRAELLGQRHGLVLGPRLSHSLLDKLDLVLRELPRADVADNPELISVFASSQARGHASAYDGEQRSIAVVRPFGMPAWLYTRLDRGIAWQRHLMEYGALRDHEGISAREDAALGLVGRQREVMAGVSDVLARGNLVEWTLRHEVGHAVDQQISWASKFSSQDIFGGWRSYPTFKERATIARDILRSVGVSDAEAGLKDEYGFSMADAFTTVLHPRGVVLHRQGKELRNVFHQFGGDLRDKGEQALRRVRLALAEPWTFADGGSAELSIDGRIYQLSAQDGWISYLADQRRYAVSNYQFSTPAEWFAEAYAAFHDPAPGPRERLNPQVREWFSRRLSTLTETAEAPPAEATPQVVAHTPATDDPSETLPISDRPAKAFQLAPDAAVVRSAEGDLRLNPAARAELDSLADGLADGLADQGLERWQQGALTAESENQETVPAAPGPASGSVPTPEAPSPKGPFAGEVVPTPEQVAEALGGPAPGKPDVPRERAPLDVVAKEQNWVWRRGNGALWRNDDREPATVFAEGFQPKNPANMSLMHHVMKSIDPNGYGFVSTSSEKRLDWAANYRYKIKAPGGIDVNRTFPGHKHSREMEVAFPGGIDPRYIKGAFDLDPYGMPVRWIPNPGYESLNGPGLVTRLATRLR